MGADGSEPVSKPLVEPRLIRLLKDRPRLIKGEYREQFLQQLEDNVRNRRVPDTVAEKMVEEFFNRTQESAKPVVRDSMKKKMRKANEGAMERL